MNPACTFLSHKLKEITLSKNIAGIQTRNLCWLNNCVESKPNCIDNIEQWQFQYWCAIKVYLSHVLMYVCIWHLQFLQFLGIFCDCYTTSADPNAADLDLHWLHWHKLGFLTAKLICSGIPLIRPSNDLYIVVGDTAL